MVKTPDNAIELNKRAINRLQLTPFMAVEDSPFYPQIVQAMQFPVSRPFYEFSLDHSDIIALASFHLPFGPISRLDAITRRQLAIALGNTIHRVGNHYNLDTQPNDTKLDPNLHDCVILHECDHLDALPIRFNRQAWIRITLIKDGNGVLNIGGEALYDTEEVPPKINAKVAVAPHTLSFEDKRFAQDQAQKTGDPTFIGWITSTIAIKKSNSVLDRRT